MGIHGNATCQMVLDGAVGTLVGQPNKGLAAMFVMMNAARLGVGNQSLGLTEVAYQNALAYAKDRVQMRSLTGVKAPGKPADPIIVHPDVRRMLMTAKAYAEGGRALACYCALLLDKELNHPDEAVRAEAAEVVALLTPIVKAFTTDNAWEATSVRPSDWLPTPKRAAFIITNMAAKPLLGWPTKVPTAPSKTIWQVALPWMPILCSRPPQ